MSLAHACSACRNAKVKCDRVRPTCSRCKRKGLPCTGYCDGDIFRLENERAKRNSQRARGECPATDIKTTRPGTAKTNHIVRQQYYWLNSRSFVSLPEPLKRDIESRAIDRAFFDWTLQPGTDGLSLGHMYGLPQLYESSAPGSTLRHAVSALAYANVKNAHTEDGLPFHIQARRSYGMALKRMRQSTTSPEAMATNETLAALLLIDSFESMYLEQREPLGAHSEAVKFVLNSRGVEQLHDKAQFALFRTANCRLQARQLLLHEDPAPIQLELLERLTSDLPDLRISKNITRMGRLSVRAARLRDVMVASGDCVAQEAMKEVRSLVEMMRESFAVIEAWKQTLTSIWRPREEVLRHESSDRGSDHPLTYHKGHTLRTYTHVWFAYIWIFHAACEIVLREDLIELISYLAKAEPRGPSEQELIDADEAQKASQALAESIVQSLPPLMGFAGGSGNESPQHPRGQAAGMFLALFSLDVVKDARLATPESRETASSIREWIRSRFALD